MVFLDFEVTKKDWLVVIIDPFTDDVEVIINDPEKLTARYDPNELYVGYNIKDYDQWIFKAILAGINPKAVNDWIIVGENPGYTFSRELNEWPIMLYDVLPQPPIGLKTLEAYSGKNIHETPVDFNINRHMSDEEIRKMVGYCKDDVLATIQAFTDMISEFNATLELVDHFKLPMGYMGKTFAGITAAILECTPTNGADEFDFIIEDYQHSKKYNDVLEWFRSMQGNRNFYDKKLTGVMVAGVLHNFGVGGIHGAIKKYVYHSGHGRQCWHIDVTSYYPSYLIAHKRITRAAAHPERYKWAYEYQKYLKANGRKRERGPWKKMLNALSGAMKDKYSPAYDPCMNNTMVVNCQLSALMLIEMLEDIPGFELVQSNTDGLIITIPDTDEAFNLMDDICYEWESMCSTSEAWIGLEFDEIETMYQGDVNNYVFKFANSDKIECKGGYVKEKGKLDMDLPIVRDAIVNNLMYDKPISETIMDCDELLQYQKVVKVSKLYRNAYHNGQRLTDKTLRVFATKDGYGPVYKTKDGAKMEKFANTPDNCRIENGDIIGAKVPAWLDRRYYIDLAEKRLVEKFGSKTPQGNGCMI